MSVIDLKLRITENWDLYNKNKKSNESLIFVKPANSIITKIPASLNINVGDKWFNHRKNTYYNISNEGVKVRPGEYVIFETQQFISLPYNVFGIIVGKGSNIYKGGIIPTSKITPGFSGCLKISFFNSGKKSILFKKCDLLACCCFFEVETTLFDIGETIDDEREPILDNPHMIIKMLDFFQNHWYSVLSLILSTIAICVALILNK